MSIRVLKRAHAEPVDEAVSAPGSTSTSNNDDTDDCAPFDFACILGGGDESSSSVSDPFGGLFPPTTTTKLVTQTGTSSKSVTNLTSLTSLSSPTSTSITTTTSSSSTSTSEVTTPPAVFTTVTTTTTSGTLGANSGSAANLVATSTPAPKGFLENKAASGAVFGVLGVLALILLSILITWRMRRARFRDLNMEAMSFDPPSIPPMQESRSLDNRSLYGRGSNSGHGHGHYGGGAPYVEAYTTAPPMVPVNGSHPQYYNPGPPQQQYRPQSDYGSVDPYGGVELAYDQPQYPVYPVSRAGGPAEHMYPVYQGQQSPQMQQLPQMAVQPARLQQSLPDIPPASLRVAVPPVDPKLVVKSHVTSPSHDSTGSSETAVSKIPAASPLPDTFGEDLTPPETKKDMPLAAAPVIEQRDSVLDAAQYFSPQPLKVTNE